MSTIGTVVDLLNEAPEAIGFVQRLVERIRDARPEDRRAIIAEMEEASLRGRASAARAAARLAAARADEPTQQVPLVRPPGDPRQP